MMGRQVRASVRVMRLWKPHDLGVPACIALSGITSRTRQIHRTTEPCGPTSEFSLFFRVKPGHGEALREALRALQDHPGYRPGDYGIAIATIHEARFVLFDDDTRLLFATSFDGPWDAYMDDFATSGPTLQLFDAIFQHTEGYDGLPDLAVVKAFILSAQVSAAAYARNYPGTVKEIRKALRVNKAFQQVLDDPEAATALQHPALKPLLDEAADST
jgi:hypothetical protein